MTSRPTLSLAGHPWADRYFARSTPWEWHDDARIDLNDGTTLDQLSTVVFHGAEGLKTVADYFAWLLTQYPDPDRIPDDLDEQVVRILADLEGRRAIEVTDDKRPVEPRFDLPLSEQEADDTR